MTSNEILNYQMEYGMGGLTVVDLCSKYKVKRKQLKGYTKWQQPPAQPPEQTNSTQVIVEPLSKHDIEVLQKPGEVEIVPEENQLLADIALFKKKAVKYALDSITDPEYLEVREFKDLVSIVDTVEKSEKADGPAAATTVNVMINNMMAGLKDDC